MKEVITEVLIPDKILILLEHGMTYKFAFLSVFCIQILLVFAKSELLASQCDIFQLT